MTIRAAACGLLALLLVACSGGADNSAGNGNLAAESNSESHTHEGGNRACEILTVEFVREVLGAKEFTAEESPSQASTFESCSLSWPSGMKREMDVMGHKVEVADDNRVSLTIARFERGKDQDAYNSGTSYLKRKNDTQPIDGVGDEALWVPKMNQLTLRGGGHVIHVSVHFPEGEGEDLDDAKKMALAVLEKLG